MAKVRPVLPSDVTRVTASTCNLLQRHVDADWTSKAGPLRWTCLRTAWHIGDVLIAYAYQITTKSAGGWVPFRTRVAHA